MPAGDRLARLSNWVEGLSPWARPPVYGALFLAALIGVRGAIGIPVVVIILVLTSEHVTRDLLAGTAIIGAAILGGALSGAAYAVAQRWIAPLPGVGRSLAGMVTVAPYMLVVSGIVHVTQSEHWHDPIGGADVFAFVLCTIIFGLALAAD